MLQPHTPQEGTAVMCGSLSHQHGEGTRDGVEVDTLATVCICTSPNRIKLANTTIVVF